MQEASRNTNCDTDFQVSMNSVKNWQEIMDKAGPVTTKNHKGPFIFYEGDSDGGIWKAPFKIAF